MLSDRKVSAAKLNFINPRFGQAPGFAGIFKHFIRRKIRATATHDKIEPYFWPPRSSIDRVFKNTTMIMKVQH